MHVAVVGAGVSGLAAARELAQRPGLRVSLLEQDLRVGGLVRTVHDARGFLLEHGPDSLNAMKPVATAMASSVGLEQDIVSGTGAPRSAFVVRAGRFIPLPPGLFSFSPSAARGLFTSSLLDVRAKLRLLCEPWLPARRDGADESLSSFVTRRFGGEFLSACVEPLMTGIYGAPPDRLSAAAILPELTALERRYGSVVRGVARRARKPAGGSSSPRAAVVSLRRGMQSLPLAMAEGCQVALHVGVRVRRVRRLVGGYELTLARGKGSLRVDALVLALPAHAAAALTEALDPELAQELGSITHTGYAAVHLGYRREQVPHPMAGTGFVVPAREQRAISACTWVSEKWPGRAPEGTALLRCFLRQTDAPDRELILAARAELADLMGVRDAPLLQHVSRRAHALPCYEVGHHARVARIEAGFAELGAIAYAGNALHGVGIPECLASGQRAARSLLT